MIELKKEIIQEYKVAKINCMVRKTLSMMLKREAIKETNVANGMNVLMKQRSQTIEGIK